MSCSYQQGQLKRAHVLLYICSAISVAGLSNIADTTSKTCLQGKNYIYMNRYTYIMHVEEIVEVYICTACVHINPIWMNTHTHGHMAL